MELTLLTWNLKGSRGPDVAAVVDHARTVGADVLALQEVQRHQARAIARALGAASCRWGFKHWPVRTRAEGMAVVGVTQPVRVRTWALSFRFRPWSWRRRIFQVGVQDEGGTALVVANLHLSPHRQADLRAREVETVLRRLSSEPGPAVVAGDLNDRPGSTVLAMFGRAGLRDAWAELHPDAEGAEGATNWSGWQPDTTEPPSQRIDYVLVPPEVEVVRVVVPRPGDHGFARFAALSDHLPVAAKLALGDHEDRGGRAPARG